jgi:hypothetical protein
VTALLDALGHLQETIADHLRIPRCDDLEMPEAIRDALAEVRRLAGGKVDGDEAEIDLLEDENRRARRSGCRP